MICPLCQNENSDNWPLEIDGKVVEGGCQDCWESQCDDAWWQMMEHVQRQREIGPQAIIIRLIALAITLISWYGLYRLIKWMIL